MRLAAILLAASAFCSAADAPKRIVSLSPNMTEMLYGVGAFPQVVGVSDYCTYPAEAKRLPSVGGWYNPTLEKLTAMRPDLVVLDDAQAPFLQDKLRDLGLHLLIVPNHSVADVYTAIAMLGKATGQEATAAKLGAATRADLERIAKRTATLSRPTVIIIVSRTPGTLRDMVTATGGSYLTELLDIAGGRTASPADKRGYRKLSPEELLAINPEVILDFTHGSDSRLASDPLAPWKDMPELRAVRNGRIYSVGEDYVPHNSQRNVLTAQLFARLLHPEAK